jgi:cytochrome c-type biogenesis protein CcmH
MSRRPALLLLVLWCAASPLSAQAPTGVENARHVVGPPQGKPLTGAELEAETKRVALLLRCPVCQGLSVAESPSSMALNMREQVRELVAAGFQEDQVLRYFERSYGEFVRLEPPLRGVNWIVWLAPIAGLLAGGFVVFRTLRGPKRTGALPTEGEPAAAGLADDPELGPYLARVRELAYGGPGGTKPEEPKA